MTKSDPSSSEGEDKSSRLYDLANSILEQCKEPLSDLNTAIYLFSEALYRSPTPHLCRFDLLKNLAAALVTRYCLSNQLQDLNEAYLWYMEGLHGPNDVLQRLIGISRQSKLDKGISTEYHNMTCDNSDVCEIENLAKATLANFNQSAKLSSLDMAITLHREALLLRPSPHPNRLASLSGQAAALLARSCRTGHLPNIDEAVLLLREAVQMCPNPEVDHPELLLNLSAAFATKFNGTGKLLYLCEAMIRLQDVVRVTHTADSELLNISTDQLDLSCQMINLDAAISLFSECLARLPVYHPNQLIVLDDLATSLTARFEQLGQRQALDEAILINRDILQLHTPYPDRFSFIDSLSNALDAQSQLLDRHSGLDKEALLCQEGPELRLPSHSDTLQKVSTEREVSHLHCLNDERSAIVEQLRLLDGFQEFLRPKPISTLQEAAIDGPVVVLNTSTSRSDALVVTSSGVEHIALPNLNLREVNVLANMIQAATAPESIHSSLLAADREGIEGFLQRQPDLSSAVHLLSLSDDIAPAPNAQIQPDDILRSVLEVLWVSVAEPVVSSLKLEKSETPSNLRWCPTGPFTFLPIHAAGIYNTEASEGVSDYVVSSYTPTLTALLPATQLISLSSSSDFKMMAVIQPQTLPCTVMELQKIERHVPNECLVRLGIPGVPGSVEEVVSHLASASIAHFACHGQHEARSPLDSALILEDGKLKVSRILQLPTVPNALLAFLSACETAKGDKNLPDEAIHVGAALLSTGFRGVVATMWSIADADCPEVADTFYEHIFNKNYSTEMVASSVDTTQAARALHLAVAQLRSEGASFIRWVPFVHLGR